MRILIKKKKNNFHIIKYTKKNTKRPFQPLPPPKRHGINCIDIKSSNRNMSIQTNDWTSPDNYFQFIALYLFEYWVMTLISRPKHNESSRCAQYSINTNGDLTIFTEDTPVQLSPESYSRQWLNNNLAWRSSHLRLDYCTGRQHSQSMVCCTHQKWRFSRSNPTTESL